MANAFQPTGFNGFDVLTDAQSNQFDGVDVGPSNTTTLPVLNRPVIRFW